jgi:hypothetical protein
MNIVSIDFDIIMAPSIELYNSFERPPFYENYYTNLFNADLSIYSKITDWLVKWIPTLNSSDINFIESHEQIIDFIPKNESVSLFNIDHHHDLGYGPPEKLENSSLILDCGNWGLYSLKSNLIQDYTWIKNNNSRRTNYNKYQFNSKNFSDFNLDELKPDKIIICLSAPWVPQQYHTLFNLWIKLAGRLHDT